MENVSEIQSYLGGKKILGFLPKTELEFVDLIRVGFPIETFNAIRERSQLSEDTMCGSLRIAKRTAARRKKEALRLKPLESELILRLARVLVAATDVLGDSVKAGQWLLRTNKALGGVPPIELLDTGIGFQETLNVLKRIEHGVFS